MSNDPTAGLTSGYLPYSAFKHLEPTAVGVVDLDHSLAPSAPDGRPWGEGQRDALLLVRLHEEPLAVVHVDRDPSTVGEEELAAELWRSAGEAIRRHVGRYGCAQVPASADALIGGLYDTAGACPGATPANARVSVAVIISTAGRDEQLARCVRSLLAQRRLELEVVVVDNRPASGETRRTVEEIAASDPRVRYVSESRKGLSVARNRGVSETDADVVAFTDDDVVVDAGWLDWLLAPFAQPGVAASCGMVLPLELQSEAQKRFEQYAGFSKGLEGRSYDLQSGQAPGRLLYPFVNGSVGVGNNMAFRRAPLAASGGFDPALGAGSPTGSCEETWAFSKVILRGERIVYEPRALCWHEHRKDGGSLREQVFGYGLGLGAILAKALLSDPRFYTAAARSLPIALDQRRSTRGAGQEVGPADDGAPVRPEELLRARREGIMRGPLRYAKGLARTRRQGLDGVIRGE
jgi:GT2 family glycosyltransferase